MIIIYLLKLCFNFFFKYLNKIKLIVRYNIILTDLILLSQIYQKIIAIEGYCIFITSTFFMFHFKTCCIIIICMYPFCGIIIRKKILSPRHRYNLKYATVTKKNNALSFILFSLDRAGVAFSSDPVAVLWVHDTRYVRPFGLLLLDRILVLVLHRVCFDDDPRLDRSFRRLSGDCRTDLVGHAWHYRWLVFFWNGLRLRSFTVGRRFSGPRRAVFFPSQGRRYPGWRWWGYFRGPLRYARHWGWKR